MKGFSWQIILGLCLGCSVGVRPVWAASPRPVEAEVSCEILVVGGGLAGAATAYEALKAGHKVCLTEITDWLGGQISAQGTSALDETQAQRSRLYYPQGYLEMRQRILQRYGNKTPGDCWVSQVCFLPRDGHQIILGMLKAAAKQGKGTFRFFPNTVVKDLQIAAVGSGQQIGSVKGIQHLPAPSAPPLNTYPLSQTLADSYSEQDSALFQKKILRFIPPPSGQWYVVEATETGELLALADLPYRLGIDSLSPQNPSASTRESYPYCPQAYTYPFAMQATATPQTYEMPKFYPQYASFYSYDAPRYAKTPALVFTYRRIWSVNPQANYETVAPGDISMQNWGGGNDYGPGTAIDNYIYTRDQLAASGQLAAGGWQGGLRVSSLRGAEELAQGYFYWLLAGTTDAKLGPGMKQLSPNLRYLKGLDSPMGTVHGLSKYPYIREGRRLIGRYAYGYDQGFTVNEIDVSRKNFKEEPYYRETLSPWIYKDLEVGLAGLKTIDVIMGLVQPDDLKWRSRSRIYSDSVGIGNYPIDFHPCMLLSPPERPGNTERPGERQGAARTYPYQIPLRAMIPPRIDNLLVTGKNIATSHISAATYRVHSFEWSAGAATGTTAAFALETGIQPYQLVENLPRQSPNLETLQKRLRANGNPTAFPGTSIFNQDWQNW
jgi:hypothetical protein